MGERVARLVLDDAWLVDPAAGREGPADLRVEDGRITSVEWHAGAAGRGRRLVVAPAFVDLHAHFREPGGEDAETIETGLAAAAHGGYGAVCLMANTDPPIDDVAPLRRVLELAAQTRSPLRVLPYATATRSRDGIRLAPLAVLATAGAIGFSDDGSPLGHAELLRLALAEAGSHRLPVVEHPEDVELTAGAEAHEGIAAAILGLRGWPAAGETAAVARDLAVLAQVVEEGPADAAPRLHLTHLSTQGSLELVRRAKSAGLPVTCDVTPHHLCLHDGWLGGDRRFAWDAVARPWAGEPAGADAYDPSTRVNPPLRSPADAVALAAAIRDGTVDAIATDHAPHRAVDKAAAFGDAAPGISGIETSLGLVLSAVAAGQLELRQAVGALTVGPARVIALEPPALTPGRAAELVVVDLDAQWTVTADGLRSRGKNSPLLGRRLPGRVLVTVCGGRLAYRDVGRDGDGLTRG